MWHLQEPIDAPNEIFVTLYCDKCHLYISCQQPYTTNGFEIRWSWTHGPCEHLQNDFDEVNETLKRNLESIISDINEQLDMVIGG